MSHPRPGMMAFPYTQAPLRARLGFITRSEGGILAGPFAAPMWGQCLSHRIVILKKRCNKAASNRQCVRGLLTNQWEWIFTLVPSLVKQTQLALLNCYSHSVTTTKTSHKKHKQLLAPSPVIPQSCRNRFSCETLVFGLPLPMFPEFDSGYTANIWIFDTEACIIVSQSAHDMHRSAAGQEAEIQPAASSDKRG